MPMNLHRSRTLLNCHRPQHVSCAGRAVVAAGLWYALHKADARADGRRPVALRGQWEAGYEAAEDHQKQARPTDNQARNPPVITLDRCADRTGNHDPEQDQRIRIGL
jgi:hypothetical protein